MSSTLLYKVWQSCRLSRFVKLKANSNRWFFFALQLIDDDVQMLLSSRRAGKMVAAIWTRPTRPAVCPIPVASLFIASIRRGWRVPSPTERASAPTTPGVAAANHLNV